MEEFSSGVEINLIAAFENKDYSACDPYVYLECEDRIIKAPPRVLSSRVLNCSVSEIFENKICNLTIDEEEIIIHVIDSRLLDFFEQDFYVQGYLIDFYDLYATGYLDIFYDRLYLETKTYWNQINTQYVPWFYSKFFYRNNFSKTEIPEYLDELITNSTNPFYRIHSTINPIDPITRYRQIQRFVSESHLPFNLRHVPINEYHHLPLPSTGTVEEQIKEEINYYKDFDIIKSYSSERNLPLLEPYFDRIVTWTRPQTYNYVNIPLNVFKSIPIHERSSDYYLTLQRFKSSKEYHVRYLVNNDYASPGIFYPPRFQGMLYKVMETAPILSFDDEVFPNPRNIGIPLQPWMASTREFCDLVLKSSLKPKLRHVRQGLFFLYLEETIKKNYAKPTDRFIFTGNEFKRLIALVDRQVYNGFYFLPYVPKRINLFKLKRKPEISFPEPEYINERIPIVWRFKAPSGKIVRANLNGSTLTKFFLGIEDITDIDIRVDYLDSDEFVSDEDFDAYIQTFEVGQIRTFEGSQIQDLDPVKIGENKYKYRIGRYDIYRLSFGGISNYHVAAVRMNYDGENFLFYPSCMMALTTGYCPDLRYFTTKNGNPMKIVHKYLNLGFGFVLSRKEVADMLLYLSELPLDYETGLMLLVDIMRYNYNLNLVSLPILRAISNLTYEEFTNLIRYYNESEMGELNDFLDSKPYLDKILTISQIILNLINIQGTKFSPETLKYLEFRKEC